MRRLLAALAAAAALLTAQAGRAADADVLTICADPNNLPFSNAQGEGFETEIARLVARELHATPRFVWWAQRRGFVRNTVKAGMCDLWPGVATELELMTTTRPYYRSSYVFVTRRAARLELSSFDDPRLRMLTIGVQMIGNDAMNTPPAHALARRGIIANVRGFMLYGDYRRPSPPAAIVAAVAARQIDVALVWGPLAGYFAAKQHPPLVVTPLRAEDDGPAWPMTFDISMGVRKGNQALKAKLDAILERDRAEIDAILARYHVPLAGPVSAAARAP